MYTTCYWYIIFRSTHQHTSCNRICCCALFCYANYNMLLMLYVLCFHVVVNEGMARSVVVVAWPNSKCSLHPARLLYVFCVYLLCTTSVVSQTFRVIKFEITCNRVINPRVNDLRISTITNVFILSVAHMCLPGLVLHYVLPMFTPNKQTNATTDRAARTEITIL